MPRKTEEVDENLEQLRELVADNDGEGPKPKKTDRRGMLKMAGMALAGAAGAVAVRAVPASAATGGNMILGCLNSASTTTQLGGPTADGSIGFAADGAIAIKGQGDGTTGAAEVGVLGTSKSGSGTGVKGQVTTGVGGLFLATSAGGTDLKLGQLNGDSGILGSGRLSMIGRGDVGGVAPNWNPNFYLHSSLGILNFEHEFVRGNDGSIWASRYDDASATKSRWKRINAVRVDTADGTGGHFKPFRVIDTRSGARKAAGTTNAVVIAGTGSGAQSIPSDAIAVVGNLTAVSYTGPGFMTIMPFGVAYDPLHDPSSLNFITGQGAIANSFVVGLSSGKVQVYIASAASHFIIDVTGYIQ